MMTEFGNAKLHHGYLRITSRKEGYHSQKLHRLIWEKHYGPIPEGYVIHHKDGNKLNNNISNLECMPNGDHSRLHDALKDFRCGATPSFETKVKSSKKQNSSGYFRVVIRTRGGRDYYEYHWYEDGKRKTITRKTIEILKSEVLKRDLEWIEFKDAN